MKRAGRLHGERGASLVIALVFLSVFGIVTVAILGFGDASLRASQGYRTQRAANYATDAALDGAINRVRHDTTIGRDPAVFTADMCNPANNQSRVPTARDEHDTGDGRQLPDGGRRRERRPEGSRLEPAVCPAQPG